MDLNRFISDEATYMIQNTTAWLYRVCSRILMRFPSVGGKQTNHNNFLKPLKSYLNKSLWSFLHMCEASTPALR
jgi:hypothetical protein